MALRDEQADILGGPILRRPESGLFAPLSQYHFVFKSAVLFGLGLLVWIACARGLGHLKKHRELRYRKVMRRKHGIPDSDCRPFAVAYAAAKRAHLEREAQVQKKSTNHMSDHNSPVADQRTSAQRDAYALRRQVPETTVQFHDYQLPEKHVGVSRDKRAEAQCLDVADRFNPHSRRRVATPELLLVECPPTRRARKKGLVVNLDDNEESRKRSFEDEIDVEHEATKKCRIDGAEPIDTDEQANWYAQYSGVLPQQANKESLGRQPEGKCAPAGGLESSKRADDPRDEDHEPFEEVMEGVDQDQLAELEGVARGKKRDWAEAESTFGGDDEEDIRNGRASRHRKRRTIFRKGIEIPARGQKRDREVESHESEDEGGRFESSQRHAQHNSKKRRDKKALSEEADEVLVEDPNISKDLLCSGRRVGDEWEADGIQYKVGNKGERLRLTLVKKARNKYHMPQDSHHPDRSAALEIYVETWMTEEQYKRAEGKQDLAWQETPKESSGSETPNVLDSPTKNGKNLLWDSVKGDPTRHPLRQLMPVGVSTRINPFERWQLQPTPGRRVASSSTIISPILPGVSDSPTRPGFRGFSKWEKQDREAEAMARIRAKLEGQKKTQLQLKESVDIPTSAIVTEPGTKPLSIPAITLTPAPAVVAQEQSHSDQKGKSSALTFSLPPPPSTNDPTKGTVVATHTTAPGFLLPTSIPAAAPSASTFLATSSPVFPSCSFAKPLQVPSSTSIGSSSSETPTFFEKGTGTGAPHSSTPSSSILGATTQPQPSSTESSSKPASFSTTKPDASLPSSRVVIAPPITKSHISSFGGPSSSAPSVMTFGSSPAVAKADIPVPSTTTSLPEGSNSTTLLFSFSGVSPSASTGTLPTSSTPSVPKFSFGQPPATSTTPFSSNMLPNIASQPKSPFKFDHTPPGVMNGASKFAVPVADESKKPAIPAPVLGNTPSSNEPTKLFGPPLTAATSPFGKPAAVDGDSSTPTPPKSTTAVNSVFSAIPTGASVPAVSFGGISFSPKLAEESKPAPSFGGAARSSDPVSIFGGSSSGSKPSFTFNMGRGSAT